MRVLPFCVDGQPATVIIPEGCQLTAAQLRRVIPEAQVEQLGKRELKAICAASEGSLFSRHFAGTVQPYPEIDLLRPISSALGGRNCGHLRQGERVALVKRRQIQRLGAVRDGFGDRPARRLRAQ